MVYLFVFRLAQPPISTGPAWGYRFVTKGGDGGNVVDIFVVILIHILTFVDPRNDTPTYTSVKPLKWRNFRVARGTRRDSSISPRTLNRLIGGVTYETF